MREREGWCVRIKCTERAKTRGRIKVRGNVRINIGGRVLGSEGGDSGIKFYNKVI